MIPLKNILPVSTVKKNLMQLLKQLESESSSIVITRDGKAAGVLMSADEYEGLLETMEIVRDPEIMQALKRGEEDYKKGKYYTHEEVFKE